MNLKKLLKTIKLHEGQINIVLGILILIIAGILVFRYINNLRNDIPQETTQNQNENEISHTIEKGESLWTIAKKYYQKGSEWKRIADANNITDPSKIETGQTLNIPSIDVNESPVAESVTPESEAPKETSTPTPQITDESASTSSEINEDTYTVAKGDNLWNIAVRAYGDGLKWHKIAEVNKLTNPRMIHSGNVFAIPR